MEVAEVWSTPIPMSRFFTDCPDRCCAPSYDRFRAARWPFSTPATPAPSFRASRRDTYRWTSASSSRSCPPPRQAWRSIARPPIGQRAAELDTLRNGVFTAALLDVLNDRYGQNASAPIRVNSLATLLSERVLTLSGGRQTSTHNVDPIRDVLLFVVR